MFTYLILSGIYSNLFYSLSVLPRRPNSIDTIEKLAQELIAGKIIVYSFADSSLTDLIRVIVKQSKIKFKTNFNIFC